MGAASYHAYDLRKVGLPEARSQIQWMAKELQFVSRLDRGLGFLSGGRWQRKSKEQQEFAEEVQLQLEWIAENDLSYAQYLTASALFVRGRDFFTNPRGNPFPKECARFPRDLAVFPLTWGEFSFRNLFSVPAPGVLHGYANSQRASEIPELSRYALIPIQQEMIDDFLFEDEEFLRLISLKLYPVGLAVETQTVHGDNHHPVRFGEHDLLHARINYDAWEFLQKRADDHSIPDVLREYYAATAGETEQVAEDLIAETKKIQDPELRVAVRAISWDIFHENPVAFNPLDAYGIVYYTAQGRDVRYGLRNLATYHQNYGRKIKYYDARRWHLNYWSKKLPQDESVRKALLAAQESDLIEQLRIMPLGGVRFLYPARR